MSLPSLSSQCFIWGWFERLGEMFIIVTAWTAYNKYVYWNLRKSAMRYSLSKWLLNPKWYLLIQKLFILWKNKFIQQFVGHPRSPHTTGFRCGEVFALLGYCVALIAIYRCFETHRLSRPCTMSRKSEVLIQCIRLNEHNDNTAQKLVVLSSKIQLFLCT